MALHAVTLHDFSQHGCWYERRVEHVEETYERKGGRGRISPE